jgi:acyl-CoA synthetase (AMP-forming)/AMP-acid ligase II
MGDLGGRNPKEPAMPPTVSRAELTPVSFLRRTAYVFPDKVAVVHGDLRRTWREVAERVNRCANRLRDLGLQRHDRVAVLCPNTPALLEAHFAIPAAGGILVAINTRLSTNEVGYILRHAEARFLLVDAELFPKIPTPRTTPTRPSSPPGRPLSWKAGWRTKKKSSPSATPLAPPATRKAS